MEEGKYSAENWMTDLDQEAGHTSDAWGKGLHIPMNFCGIVRKINKKIKAPSTLISSPARGKLGMNQFGDSVTSLVD